MPRVDVAAQNVVYEPPIVLSCKPTTQQLMNVGRLFGFDLCCCWIGKVAVSHGDFLFFSSFLPCCSHLRAVREMVGTHLMARL